MTKLVGTTFKIINVIAVLLFLMACLIPFLPAGKYWMIAVLGLVFPLICCVVIAFFILFLLAKSKWCLLSLLALALGWQQITVIIGFNRKKTFEISKPPATLRVLSWNVSSWSETNKSIDPKLDYLPLMLNLIEKQQADVICLQEFWDKDNPRSTISNVHVINTIGYPYHYYAKSYFENRGQKTGVIIISKYPITDTAKFSYGENDFAEHLIYADIQFNNQKLRFFTTHLQSVRFDNSQYTALRKIKRQDESGLKDSRTIVHKLKNAYNFRGAEADLVQQKIKESPYPAIVCGDFNDVPNSYTYFTIKGNLQDAFLQKGTGLGRTFQYLSPTLRIDYILADKKFKVEQYNRLKVPYSDHYPIVADINIEPAK